MTSATKIKNASGDFRTLLWAGYGSITLTFGVFGTWAATAPLDSAAVASAQVAVSTNKKPVQHLEGGILREVLVVEAQRVEEGQVLFRLQPVQAQATAETLRNQLNSALAQEARLLAERDQTGRITWPEDLLVKHAQPDVAALLANQERQYTERQRSLDALISIQASRIAQTARDVSGKHSNEQTLGQQHESLKGDLAKLSGLADKGYFPRSKLSAMQRDLWRIEGDLGVVRSDIAKAAETIAESRQQMTVLRQQRIDEAAQQLADVRGRLSELREKRSVAADVVSRLEVRAPRAGIVQGIKVHTVGEVVRPGDTLADLVTPEEGLILTAQVTPSDIDSVFAGSKAEIRFPAFASRQRLATRGKIETIASDLTVDPNSRQSYYMARVAIDSATLPSELKGKLIPGMPASILITTGERTMLTYLIGPLQERILRTLRDK